MTTEQVGLIIAVASGVGSLFGWIYVGVYRVAQMQLKVDTMWEFLLRRAKVEAVQAGVGVFNSPFLITEEAKKIVAPLAPRLREFGAKIGCTMSLSELALAIERQFGEELIRDVCIPNGLHAGACLLIACAVASDID